MTGKIILHTAGSFFETGLGFWLFSKIFPRRKHFENRHLLSEIVMYTLIIFIICWNFLNDVPVSVKLAGYFIWVGGLLFYRCYVERQRKLPESFIRIVNRVLGILAVAAAASILAWNGWIGYISSGMVVLGNLFIVPFLYLYYRCSLIQAYLYEVIYSGTISLVKCAYLVYVGGIGHSNIFREVNLSGTLHNYTAILFGILVCVVFCFLVRSFSAWKLLGDMLKRHKILAGILAAGEFF